MITSSFATRFPRRSTATSKPRALENEANGALISTLLTVSIGFHENHTLAHSSVLRYEPLNLVMSSHPFFGQVWYCRHILDHNSPMLKRATRKTIRLNDGR